MQHTLQCAFLAVCAVGALTLAAGRGARADAPSVGAVTSSDTGSGVGMYQKLELTFAVTTSAPNLQLPYDPTSHTYTANLKPDEDERGGVSVDALLLPPGQADWAQAVIQPGFLYRNYTRTSPGTHKAQVENLVWGGPDTWKVRFAPTVQGKWQYRIRVTDSGGTALSDPQGFVCVSSSSKGFVRVSPTDPRYLQFDSGDPANFVGINIFCNGLDDFQSHRAGLNASGASALIRFWIAGRSGIEIIGGFANSDGGRLWDFGNSGPAPCILSTEDAHSGRFSVLIPSGGQLGTGQIPVRPGHAHTLSVWVKAVGVTGDAPQVTVSSANADTYQEGATQSFPLASLTPDARGWAQITLPIPAFSGTQNMYAGLGIALKGASGGHVLVDDIAFTDTVTGADDLEAGDFERHVHYNQRQSWLLDAIVDDCAAHGQYLRLNCLENDDSVFCNVAKDGTSAPHDPNNFFGTSTDAATDLPVRRWQRAYARYLTARWGYSTAVAQFEYNNEGALFNGNHYAAAQSFARAIHSVAAEGHRLCGTSFWQNTSGTSYPADFYDTGAYPDIDYADVHMYYGPEAQWGSFTPYNDADSYRSSFQRIANGGPNGLGCLRLDAATQGVANINILPTKVKGKGTWTVSYQARTTGGTIINRGGHGLDVGINCPVLGGTPWLALPGLAMPAQPPAPDQDWATYQSTFTVPDNAVHPLGVSLGASGGFKTGRIEVSDIKFIAPNGRLWTHYTFNEPLMDRDAASFAQYLGLLYTPLSGDPLLGKPFSIGETDVQNNSPDQLLTVLTGDNAGTFLRQFAWAHINPSGATIFLWSNAGNLSLDKGWWKGVAAYQAFLRGIPLANGRYRNIEAAVSNPNLIVIGQKDTTGGRAHVFVYNRGGNWFNLVTHPAAVVPVTGTVTVPGLPDGAYIVERWDTSTGKVVVTTTVPSTHGALVLPVTGLVSDTAFKVYPITPPAVSVSLSVDKAAARPGDFVTYTLAYGNKTASDALQAALPWPLPAGVQFVSASGGGVYDPTRNEVDWSLGTVAAGQAGQVTLTVKVGP